MSNHIQIQYLHHVIPSSTTEIKYRQAWMWPAPCATDDYGLVSDLWGQQILQYLLIMEYYRHRAESKPSKSCNSVKLLKEASTNICSGWSISQHPMWNFEISSHQVSLSTKAAPMAIWCSSLRCACFCLTTFNIFRYLVDERGGFCGLLDAIAYLMLFAQFAADTRCSHVWQFFTTYA